MASRVAGTRVLSRTNGAGRSDARKAPLPLGRRTDGSRRKECSMKPWQLLSGPILALLAGGPASAADDSHCTSVTDSAARLDCYDEAPALHPNTAAVPA